VGGPNKLLPIILGARRKSGTVFSAFKGSPEKIWRRDDHTCQFCGFRAEKYQRVVPGSWCGDERDALTACLFCEQCFSLDNHGQTGSGFLIWLPEMTQAQLNHLVRALYIAKGSPKWAVRAQAALEALNTRRAEAKKRIGTDDPLALGTVMFESTADKFYRQRQVKLEGIRLLPADRALVDIDKQGVIDQFPAILDYWQSLNGPFGALGVENWDQDFQLPATA
jgi:intracellular multiplication protein IcmJ